MSQGQNSRSHFDLKSPSFSDTSKFGIQHPYPISPTHCGVFPYNTNGDYINKHFENGHLNLNQDIEDEARYFQTVGAPGFTFDNRHYSSQHNIPHASEAT